MSARFLYIWILFSGDRVSFKTPERLSAACVRFEASTVELISINIAVSKCRIIVSTL